MQFNSCKRGGKGTKEFTREIKVASLSPPKKWSDKSILRLLLPVTMIFILLVLLKEPTAE